MCGAARSLSLIHLILSDRAIGRGECGSKITKLSKAKGQAPDDLLTHTHTRSILGHHHLHPRRHDDMNTIGYIERAAGPCVEWTRVEGGRDARPHAGGDEKRGARRGARTAHNSSVGEARSSGTKHLRENSHDEVA